MRRDVVWIVIAAVAFATSGPLGKVAASVPPTTVACARTAIAGTLLALVAPRAFGRSVAGLTRRQKGGVLGAGALLAGHFVLFLGGLGATSLAAAVALIALEPLAVVLAAFFAFGLRPTRREAFALAVATAGAVVVSSGAGEGEHRLSGDVMVLGAVALYGAYVAAARSLRDALPAAHYAGAVYLAATVVLLPLASRPSTLSSRALVAIVALGLVPTLIGHTLVQRAARTAAPVLVALVSPGETIGAIAISCLAMGAVPTMREGAGAALVLAGATIAITGRR